MANLQILLRQHVGAPCAPVVKAGDRVEKGTLIATPTGLGANIFSSAYGVVEDVLEDRIIIKPDEEQKDVTVCVIGTNAYSRPGSTVTPGVVSMSSGIAGVTLKTTSISADSTANKLDFAKGAQGETTLDEDCVGK